MRKKSAIMTAIIAAIITTSVLAFALPKQVFAGIGDTEGMSIFVKTPRPDITLNVEESETLGHVPHVGQVLAGHEAQLGGNKAISGHDNAEAQLGNNPTNYNILRGSSLSEPIRVFP